MACVHVVNYITPDGKDVYREWRGKLRDAQAGVAADRRLARLEDGNFGDHKYCQDGVWELRIDVGPGYRTYYALAGAEVVVLYALEIRVPRSRIFGAP